MKSILAFSTLLRARVDELGLTQAELADAAGVSRRTLTQVLGGKTDFRIGTLIALADRLGLEVLMVPGAVAETIAIGNAVTKPVVKSRVREALDKVRRQP
jgi:transcriptional regulator with XRE-family HTH domain